jgi:hypothetical protein
VTHRCLAALTAALAACAAHAESAGDPPPDAALDAKHAPLADLAEAGGSDPWPNEPTPPPPPPPRCTPQPSGETCRPGGFMCDVAHDVVCCGSCIDGMCCAAVGQACSDVGLDTCCAGLHCGNRCVCE